MDMCSGGSCKEDWAYIFIEAPKEEAETIFYNRFNHNPERVTCTCCGSDYSIHERENLEQATGYYRGCRHANFDENGKELTKDEYRKMSYDERRTTISKYVEEPDTETTYSWRNKYIPLDEYVHNKNCLFIYDKDIKPEERQGVIPEQGYVWVGE